MPNVALLTDFGIKDWYVASMKGVILSICPNASLVDITHEVPKGNMRSGGFLLSQCFFDFPDNTTFLAVVDPGVGSKRNPVAVLTANKILVGPDNGLFDFLFQETFGTIECRIIRNKEIIHPTESHTFDGRDIFAPTAAHLAAGFPFKEVGPAYDLTSKRKGDEPHQNGNRLQCQILYIDDFGNIITNINKDYWIKRINPRPQNLEINQTTIPFCHTYSDVEEGQLLAYIGSGGYLEIAVNKGNAAAVLRFGTETNIDISLPNDNEPPTS